MVSAVLLSDQPCTHTLADGEQVEMGGIVDPERGALIYKKTTKTQVLKEDSGEYQERRIKTVIDEHSWIGKPSQKKKQPSAEEAEESFHDPPAESQLELNPLYSAEDYASDYQNPLYSSLTAKQAPPHSSSRAAKPPPTGAKPPSGGPPLGYADQADTLF